MSANETIPYPNHNLLKNIIGQGSVLNMKPLFISNMVYFIQRKHDCIYIKTNNCQSGVQRRRTKSTRHKSTITMTSWCIDEICLCFKKREPLRLLILIYHNCRRICRFWSTLVYFGVILSEPVFVWWRIHDKLGALTLISHLVLLLYLLVRCLFEKKR